MFSPEFDYSEYENSNDFISTLSSSLGGLKFYSLIYTGWSGFNSKDFNLCTYRDFNAVKDVFKKDYAIVEYGLDEIAEEQDFFPVYCVELHGSYKYIDYLMKDIMISKISGMMGRELNTENKNG